MPPISASELFDTLAAPAAAAAKLDAVARIKTHVKKDLVDLRQVPKYLEALSIGVDIHDAGISGASFSVLCHLIKRVGMQDKTGDLLRRQSFLVLPIVVNRLGDSKSSTKSAAKKALEAYWFSAPQQVESALKDMALCHRSAQIVGESVAWLQHIIANVNPHFDLAPLLEPLVDAVARAPDDVAAQIVELFRAYYGLKHNRLYRYDLSKQLDAHGVDSRLKLRIENAIGVAQPRVLEREPVPEPVQKSVPEPFHEPSQEPFPPAPSQTYSSEIDTIVSALPNYDLDDSVAARDVQDGPDLLHVIRGLLPAFNSRETEHNWSRRERSIITLRELVRGNALGFLDAFIAGIKEISDGICKSVLSLRTTLSSHGCHLVKDLVLTMGTAFEPLIESFLPTLVKLTSMNKNIASSNANVALCAIFINCVYSPRVFQRVYNSAVDKNIRTRSFSALWLQIMIVRFHDNLNFLSPHGNSLSGYDHFVSSLAKLLADPNPNVRLAAKDTYWSFANYFPEQSGKLLSRLEPNVVRAIERSKPQGNSRSTFRSISADTSNRPSLKQAIIAKNKELRQKQKLENARSRSTSRPTSRPSSRQTSDSKEEPRKAENRLKRSQSVLLSGTNVQKPTHSHSLSEYHIHHLPNVARKLEEAENYDAPVENPKEMSIDPHLSSEIIDNQSSPTKYEEFTSSYNKQDDPILKFLSSNDTSLVKEGISLLKFAIKGGEDFPDNMKVLLLTISKNDVSLLKPLFTGKDLSLDKVYQFFEPEDFFRICTLLIENMDEEVCNAIISLFNLDDIYTSITSLLAYCFNIENLIGGDNALAIQAIKFKSTIVKSIIDFMLISSNKIPISDKHFSSIVSSLFELVNLLKSTALYSSFSELLRKLYSINQVLFLNELDPYDPTVKEEVGYIVDLNGTTELSTMGAKELTTSNFYDLTKVLPTHDSNVSPFKGTSDLTMLMPVSGGDDFTFKSIKMSKHASSSESDRMEIDAVSGKTADLPSTVPHIVEPKEVNVFLDKPTALIDNFASVKISDKKLNKDPLQKFVDIIDPLKRISDKVKPIDIYEDPNSRGSPTKTGYYDYTEFSWFNFHVAESAGIDTTMNKTDYSRLCTSLGNNSIHGKEFLLLLHYLQSSQHFDLELANYFQSEGQAEIQISLWKFFDQYKSLTRSRILSGLIILKQLLIDRIGLEIDKIFEVLTNLSSEDDDMVGELSEAISENFDELLQLYQNDEILSQVINGTKTLVQDDPEGKLTFTLDCVVKTLNTRTINSGLNETEVNELDSCLHRFLNHSSVKVRRLVILAYSRLCQHDSDRILSKLNTSQRKLVEYYSRL